MSSKGYYTVFGEYKTINDNVIEHMSDNNDDIDCPEGMKCIPANEYQNMESQILEKMMRKMQNMDRKMQNMDDRLDKISVAASDQPHFDHSMIQTVAGDEVEHSGHSMSIIEKQQRIIDSVAGDEVEHSGMPTTDDICEYEFTNVKFEENSECEGHLKFMNNLCKDEVYRSESVDQCNKYREYANNFCGDSEYRGSNEDFCKDLSS